MVDEKILTRPIGLKISEFLGHLPVTIIASGVTYLSLRKLSVEPDYASQLSKYFHIFIYLHFFLSASTTSAVYFKHTNKLFKAGIVGMTGSAVFCSVSDILLPYIGSFILGINIKFHFCLFEDIAIIFIFLGAFIGILLFRFFLFVTYVTHPFHILSSVLASFFYLGSFSRVELHPLSIIIVILSVLIPCTFSDFVYPMLFVHKSCCLKKYT